MHHYCLFFEAIKISKLQATLKLYSMPENKSFLFGQLWHITQMQMITLLLHFIICMTCSCTRMKANIILEILTVFTMYYQYMEIIVCSGILLHYCVSFSCLINNDGWLLFSSPPATIKSLLDCRRHNNKRIVFGCLRENICWVLAHSCHFVSWRAEMGDTDIVQKYLIGN